MRLGRLALALSLLALCASAGAQPAIGSGGSETRSRAQFVRCAAPTNVQDGGGFGNLSPLLVRRVSCGVGLRVATKRRCARQHTCTVAGIHWTCAYRSIAVETVRGWCRAPVGRRVKWIAGGAE